MMILPWYIACQSAWAGTWNLDMNYEPSKQWANSWLMNVFGMQTIWHEREIEPSQVWLTCNQCGINRKQTYLVNYDWHATTIKERIEVINILQVGRSWSLIAIFCSYCTIFSVYIIYEKSSHVSSQYIKAGIQALPFPVSWTFLHLHANMFRQSTWIQVNINFHFSNLLLYAM